MMMRGHSLLLLGTLTLTLVSLASAQFFSQFLNPFQFNRPQFNRRPQQFNRFPQQQFNRGGGLYFSWRDPRLGRGAEFDWFQANRICQQRGQSLVSIDSVQKSNQINNIVGQNGLKFIWTSGRRSQFGGFVWANGRPVQPLNWSRTGLDGRPQPDNREGNENCLGLLNNFYQDGIVWHDVACHHLKPFICE